jgi:hypothetical protein
MWKRTIHNRHLRNVSHYFQLQRTDLNNNDMHADVAARSNTTNTTSAQSAPSSTPSPATSTAIVPTNSAVGSTSSQSNSNSAARDPNIQQGGVVAATVALIYGLLL